MTAVFDVDQSFFVDFRLHVVIPHGHCGQGGKDINARDRFRSALDPQDLRSDLIAHIAEQIVFQSVQAVLRAHDDVFQLF